MHSATTNISLLLFSIASAMLISCGGQTAPPTPNDILNGQYVFMNSGDTVSEVSGEIRGIFQDSKNNLWFASNGDGVFKYDGKTILRFTEKHGLCSPYAWNVQEGKDGNIWFKTNIRPKDIDAICHFDGKVFKTIAADTNSVQTVDFDYQKDELLFDYCYDGKTLAKIQLPHTSPLKNEDNIRHHYDVFCTLKDSKGNLWFGTATAGICKYDGKTFTWFDNKELGAAVRSIFEDKDGTIWAGNNGDGLFRYDGQGFTNFSREKNLHNPDFEKYPIGKPGLLSRVWTIADDKQGNLWVGTIDNGVWRYDGKTFTNFTTKDGLGTDGIWVIFKDNDGNLWFGTEGAGVFVFDGKKFKKFTTG
jgi:ligand-binding sensor domain-containing protein